MRLEIKSSQSKKLLESFRSDHPAQTSLTLSAAQGEESVLLEKSDGNVMMIAASDLTELPLADHSVGRLECVLMAHRAPDIYRMLLECHRVLQPGGYILLVDYQLPDDERTAHYIDALFRLREAQYQQSYPDYMWQGTLLDAGFVVDTTESMQEKLPLIASASISEHVRTHLHVMTLQAPTAVREWLKPEFVGTDYAAFTAHIIALIAHKEAS